MDNLTVIKTEKAIDSLSGTATTLLSRLKKIEDEVYGNLIEYWLIVKQFKSDKELVKALGYTSFDDFCVKELAKDNSQVYRQIDDAVFKKGLIDNLGGAVEAGLVHADEAAIEVATIKGLKESNTRLIRRLPEDAREGFWKLAYFIGLETLERKDDGSIEPTTEYLEKVLGQVEEFNTLGGVTIDGKFISKDKIGRAAEIYGVDEAIARAMFVAAGVGEAVIESVTKHKAEIREKASRHHNFEIFKGVIEVQQYGELSIPIIVTGGGDEIDMNEYLKGYVDMEVTVSIKSPLKIG